MLNLNYDKVVLIKNEDGTFNCTLETQDSNSATMTFNYPRTKVMLEMEVLAGDRGFGTFMVMGGEYND